MTRISIDEQIAAVKRELGLRTRVYPRWIDAHKMTQEKAAHEIEAMRAALATLERVKANQSEEPQ